MLGYKDLTGQRVRVVQCQSRKHNHDDYCVCHLLDEVVIIEGPAPSVMHTMPVYTILEYGKIVLQTELAHV